MLYDPKWEKKKRRRQLSLPEIYGAAADEIQERGHSIGRLRDSKGRMCIWGAISFVVSGDALDAPGNKTHRMLDPLHEFTKGASPVAWNNELGRTKRQVVNLLRRASRTLAARELVR